MLFSLEAVSAKEFFQLAVYALTFLILWRFSVQRAGNKLLKIIVVYFLGETLDQSADALILVTRQLGTPPPLYAAWHIWTRFAFLFWATGVGMLLWSMLGDRLKSVVKVWISGHSFTLL